MKIIPDHPDLRKHIEYYWIVKDASALFDNVQMTYDFPGTSPEMIFLLDGEIIYYYKNRVEITLVSTLVGHIDSFFQLRPAKLKSFIVVRFKSRSLSSLLPFINIPPQELIKNPIQSLSKIFRSPIEPLVERWKNMSSKDIVPELDELLYTTYNSNREGFVTEFFTSELANHKRTNLTELTHYSPSTLLRYFKKETGLSPKYFQSLKRFKACVTQIYETNNTDWISYVEEFGYYDQSHFIKEIKRFSQFTPSQLIKLKALERYRPL